MTQRHRYDWHFRRDEAPNYLQITDVSKSEQEKKVRHALTYESKRHTHTRIKWLNRMKIESENHMKYDRGIRSIVATRFRTACIFGLTQLATIRTFYSRVHCCYIARSYKQRNVDTAIKYLPLM